MVDEEGIYSRARVSAAPSFPPAESPHRASQRRHRHRALILVGILLLAVGLRVAYHRQLSPAPEMRQHLSAESDMAFFDTWGQSLAAGDWLTDQALHPHHSWRTAIARLWFSWHPDERALWSEQAAAAGQGAKAEDLLWNFWFGGKQFHQEPLYAYTLGVFYVLGGGVGSMLMLQMILGVVCVWLVHRITGRAFGARAAHAAALLTVLYGPLLLYDLVLLRATPLVAVGLWLVDRADVAFRRETLRSWAAFGLACGLAVLLKTTYVLFFLGILAALILRRRAWREGMLSCAVFAACLLPVVMRNLAVGAPLLGLSSLGPDMMALNNSAGAQASLSGFVPNPHGMAEILGTSAGNGMAVVRASLSSLGSFSAFWELAVARLAHAFHWYEIPNNVNFYVFREQAPVLGLAAVNMVWVLPLAVLGLLCCGRRRCGPALWLVLTSLAPLVVFGIVGRYRLLFAVALLPFAGFGAVRLWSWLGRRRWKPAALALAGGALLACVVARPLPEDVSVLREADYTGPWSFAVQADVEQAKAEGDAAEAVSILEDFLARAPAELEALRSDEPAPTLRSWRLAQFYAPLYERLAYWRGELGDEPGAQAARVRSRQLDGAAKALERAQSS